MTSTVLVAAAVALLSMGAVSLTLAFVAGRYSVRGGGRRAAALAMLGIVSLSGMVVVLQGEGWPSVRDDVLWPLAVLSAAALGGAGLGAGLLYGLVAAR